LRQCAWHAFGCAHSGAERAHDGAHRFRTMVTSSSLAAGSDMATGGGRHCCTMSLPPLL
jgi:hypothetical protein